MKIRSADLLSVDASAGSSGSVGGNSATIRAARGDVGELPVEITEHLRTLDTLDKSEDIGILTSRGVDYLGFDEGALSPAIIKEIADGDTLNDGLDTGQDLRGGISRARGGSGEEIHLGPPVLVLGVDETTSGIAQVRVESAVGETNDGVDLRVHHGVVEINLANTRVGLHQATAVVTSGIMIVGGRLVSDINDGGTIGTKRAVVGGNTATSEDVDGDRLDHPVLHASLGEDTIAIVTEVLDVEATEVISTDGDGTCESKSVRTIMLRIWNIKIGLKARKHAENKVDVPA
jgi:hypothetical protein